jgi:alkylhydroperoxidase family enzyme
MSTFTIHDLNSAPEDSKPLLENSLKGFGMIPNLHGVMAEAPSVLEAYQQLHRLFQDSSFDKDELTVIWQTINVEHECHYCVPAHTAVAHMMKVDAALTEALRNGEAMPTEKLQILHDTTLAMLRKRGRLSEDEIAAFYAAGYQQQQLLEIVLGLAQKVMSNYVNHIAKTPIDGSFLPFSWDK